MTLPSVEFLIPRKNNGVAEPMLRALQAAALEAGQAVRENGRFSNRCDWLVLFGVGAADRNEARNRQRDRGKRTIMWDHGYVERDKRGGHLRMSIDHDHPWRWFDATAPDPSRWDALGVPLREDADPSGPIILVGLGGKSRLYLKDQDWEARTLGHLMQRFPGQRIIHRPKPGHDFTPLHCDRDIDTPIAELLKGASRVVCRHSNVAVDAIVAGVPFECVDGAAYWMLDKPFTPEVRLDFLRRLAWWQWRVKEAPQAWQFITRMLGEKSA